MLLVIIPIVVALLICALAVPLLFRWLGRNWTRAAQRLADEHPGSWTTTCVDPENSRQNSLLLLDETGVTLTYLVAPGRPNAQTAWMRIGTGPRHWAWADIRSAESAPVRAGVVKGTGIVLTTVDGAQVRMLFPASNGNPFRFPPARREAALREIQQRIRASDTDNA